MKTLFLVRHAKSDWGAPDLADHERPLNRRGRRDAAAMGAALAERGVRPSVILASDAVRARTTAGAIAEAIGAADALVLEPGLYAATAGRILGFVGALPASAERAMLVGHNPGMSDAVTELTGEWAELPTCAVVEIALRVDDWAEVVEGVGTIVRSDAPARE